MPAFYPFSCMVLSAGQLVRGMYTRLMLSVNGVCESCWESNGTIMCGMTMRDGQLSNHTYRPLFKHGVSPFPATLRECQTNQMPSRSYPPPENWRRPSGRPHNTWMKTIQQDLKSMNLSVNEAIDMAQNRPLWTVMSTFGATHS